MTLAVCRLTLVSPEIFSRRIGMQMVTLLIIKLKDRASLEYLSYQVLFCPYENLHMHAHPYFLNHDIYAWTNNCKIKTGIA